MEAPAGLRTKRDYYSAVGPLRCAVRAARKPRAYILVRPSNACVAPLRAAVDRRRSKRTDVRVSRRCASPGWAALTGVLRRRARRCAVKRYWLDRSGAGELSRPNSPARRRIGDCAMLALLGLSLTCARADTSRESGQATQWHRTNIHGHLIYYASRGSGSTMVFLHGGGDSGEHSFVRQLDVFSEHHFILAPDQVGQGRTPEVPGPLSYTAMMEDTAELLRVLKLRKVDFVGFSDGGILALMLAIRHPELVRRLVISGVNIAPEGLRPEDLEELRATQIPKPKTIDEKLAHLWFTSPTDAELNLGLLAKLSQPVLLISGDRDAITLEHTLRIFHALPDAQLCVLPGTDHATFSGRSDWLNPIIDAFLNHTP
jgi:pimeloyl-ACP methyl ester carboxylesterase